MLLVGRLVGDGKLNVWPPISPRALWTRQAEAPFPLNDPRCRVYDLGRNALWRGLKALGLGDGDELLMPAYHCGTEIGAAVDLGITPKFWAGTETLAPAEEELDRLVGPQTRGLYLTHHLGFAQDAPRWRRWCDERDLLLLEDVAPAWLSSLEGRPLGSWGDLSIYSPRKTLGLPEGGAVLCDPPPEALSPSSLPGKEILKAFVRWPAQRSRLAVRVRRHNRQEPFDPAREFAVHAPDRGISRVVLALTRRLSNPVVAEKRRRNYEWLIERIGACIPSPFDCSPGEGCPFGIPVTVEDKKGFSDHLAVRGIGAIDFWSRAHPIMPDGEFPDIDRRRSTTVLLPVHQGLRPRDLDRVARAVVEW